MLAWVVIFRSTHRQPRKSGAISLFCSASLRSPSHIHYVLISVSLISHLPYLLPSSVSRKSFACHSYEYCRGVYQFFPIRSSKRRPWAHFPIPYSLPPIPFLFTFFHTLLRFFALRKNSTLFFSTACALFISKHRGGVPTRSSAQSPPTQGCFCWLPSGWPSPLPSNSCGTLTMRRPMNRASGLRIGKILGIPIYLHSTWVFIFAAITWIIASQYKRDHPSWTDTQHYAVGVLTSLIFFASVLFHELAHSAVAQHYKIRVVSITLFLFGGLARIEREPSKAIQEFNIAIAGPLASGFLSAGVFGLTLLFQYSQTVGALATWLWQTNFALAVFNLLPGFPLDGGRIFRAIVWGATKNFDKATRVAGASGKIIAYAMILLGAYGVFNGVVRQGLWLAFIGWFILNAAQESVAQVAVRETLTGLSAADVMSKEVPTVPGHITLEEYSAEVLRTGRRVHLVVNDERFAGMMNVHTLNSIPRDEWAHNSVQAVMIPREKILWTSPEEPLLGLLERLLSADVNQMPVVTGATDGSPQIVGIVTRDSILRVVQTRSELGPLATSR